MAEIKSDAPSVGQIQIANEVIAIIAGTAALEVEGVVSGPSGGIITPGDFAEILGKRNFSKGVKVTVADNQVSVEMNLLVKFGYKIQDISVEAQKRVKNAIETMTGLTVSEVNISVTGIQMEKPAKHEKQI